MALTRMAQIERKLGERREARARGRPMLVDEVAVPVPTGQGKLIYCV